MLKDYSYGQDLIVLEDIGLNTIYRNDFYRKTKGVKKKQKCTAFAWVEMYDLIGDNVCVIL